MMRDVDVKGLLSHVEKELASLKNEYDHALQDKDIPISLRIKVKSIMEHLRSSLDYMAHDVAESISSPVKKIYFPYGNTHLDFENSVKKSLPNFKNVKPDIYSLFESVQPHACHNQWLYNFCQITNKNKHNSLTPQIRTSQTTYCIGSTGKGATISSLAGAIQAPPGAISIDGIPIIFNPSTGIPQQMPGLEVSVTKWVNFKFADTDVEVYPLLITAFEKIKEIAKELYHILIPPNSTPTRR